MVIFFDDKLVEGGGRLRYVGLTKRLFTTATDIVIVCFCLMPLLALNHKLLYGERDPNFVVENVVRSANGGKALHPQSCKEKRQMTDTSGVTNPDSRNINIFYVWKNPEIQHYLYEEHGLIKIIFDVSFQATSLIGAFALFWIFWGTTPAKRLMSIKIVDAETLGKPTRKQMLIRILGVFIAVLPAFLGMVWITFDKRRQGWHDKLARTLVVRT